MLKKRTFGIGFLARFGSTVDRTMSRTRGTTDEGSRRHHTYQERGASCKSCLDLVEGLGDLMDVGMPRIGLVLGAGAARGWAHIGVLRALAAHDIRPDVICGCSIGALVAASHVTGHLGSLEKLARSLSTSRVIRYFDISLRGGGLIEGRWIINFFRENVEDTTIENTDIIFGAVATDLASGRETWLTSGSIIDAVRASIAVPGLLTPIQIRGRWHIDGALVNPLPVSLCRALGADVIIGVNLNGNLMSRPDLARAGSGAPTKTTEPDSEGSSSWLEWMGYSQNIKDGEGRAISDDCQTSGLPRGGQPDVFPCTGLRLESPAGGRSRGLPHCTESHRNWLA